MTGRARYPRLFERLRGRNEGAFVPFLVLGDPDRETSLALLHALIRGGADALELGMPFSDPIADGPVIQAAATRVLARGGRVEEAWTLLTQVREAHPEVPIGLLVYANLVLHRAPDRFYQDAARAGVDSVLVADLPLLEADRVVGAARSHGIAPVFIAPPDADDRRLDRIAERSEGYVYVTSRRGVTGADAALHRDSAHLLDRLRSLGAAPPLLGFGIAAPDHVRQALALGAAGAISGSAVVRLVAESAPEESIERVEAFVRGMKAATQGG